MSTDTGRDPGPPDDGPVRLVSITACGDFEGFMEMMDADRPSLAEHGVIQRSIYRAVDDPNEVMVAVDLRSRTQAEQLLARGGTDHIQKWLERAKVSIYPSVFIGMEIERIVCDDDPKPSESEAGATSS